MNDPENPENDTDERLAADSLPREIDDAAIPITLDQIFPWHTPRKQFVRERQWITFSRSLISKEIKAGRLQAIGGAGRAEVRYLTLPGHDYLDVRMLADVCKEFDCDLTSTGFLSGDESNPVTARAKLRQKSLIDEGLITSWSHTFPRRIEEISSIRGQAYRDLRRRTPFHIVNIDACGSVALPSADHAHRLVDAIYRIVELQFEMNNSGSWLLFLTNDVRRSSLSTDAMTKFSRAIIDNAKKNEAFSRAAIKNLEPGQEDIEHAIAAAADGSGGVFMKLFAMGFAKWLLDLAKARQYGVKMHNSYCYSQASNGSEITMPCLAFEFLGPNPGLQDSLGVARVPPKEGGTAEDLSVRIAEKVSKIMDLDGLMRSDDATRLEMAENMRALLREAGYAEVALESV